MLTRPLGIKMFQSLMPHLMKRFSVMWNLMLKDDHYYESSETKLPTLDDYKKKMLRWMTPVQLEADVAIKMYT